MATNMPTRVGGDHKLVTIINTDAASGIAIGQDALGARYQIRMDVKRAKGLDPKPGEQWAIDRELGVWTCVAVYGYSNAQAVTDYGATGGSGSTAPFVYEQTSAATTWTVPHNLGHIPQVTVTDASGFRIWPDISYPDNNTVVISMTEPMTGFVYCL